MHFETESPDYIHDVELAEVMAHAENPYRELAAIAIRNNQQDFARSVLIHGDAASEYAGRVFLQSRVEKNDFLSSNIDSSYVPQMVEPDTVLNDEADPLEEIRVSKEDFITFAIEKTGSEQNGKILGGRIWHRLSYSSLIDFRSDLDDHNTLGTETFVHRERRGYSLASLVRLLKYYDDEKAKFPHAKEHEILGRMWGPVVTETFRELVESKVQSLEQEQPQQ